MVCCPKQKHVERGRAGTEVLYIGVNFFDARELREGVFSDAKYGIGEYLEKIYAETRNPSAVSDELCALYCRIIGLKLIRRAVGEGRRRDLEFLSQYIAAHCSEDLDIASLAEISGYSYDHFRKLFVSRFGTTVNDYVLHKRIERASEMLETSGLSVKEIAAECGFSSSARFCTKFKELTGKTPKQAQRSHALERATVNIDKFS